MKYIRLVLSALLVLTLYGTASAFTLNFDELDYLTPVDGLSYQGITFGYTVGGVNSSTDAYYNVNAPGPNVQNIDDAVLTGSAAGVLSLDFATPVRSLGFDLAYDIIGPLSPGFFVSLFDTNLNALATSSIRTDSLQTDFLSEGSFSYSGQLLSRAVIEFSPEAGVFALDNLSYDSVPEPSTILLLAAGLGGLACIRRKTGTRRRIANTRRERSSAD